MVSVIWLDSVHAAPVAAVHAVPAVNVHAVHTTVPVAVPTATVHKTVQTHLVPQTRLVGHQVSHSVHHVPRVHVDTKTSTHTTHHVINHPPVVGAFAGAALPAGLVAGAVHAPIAAVAAAAPAVERIHRDRYMCFDRRSVAGYLRDFSHDIICQIDDLTTNGIKELGELMVSFEKVLFGGEYDGCAHQIVTMDFEHPDDATVVLKSRIHLWQHVIDSGVWTQQIYNKEIDKEPQAGQFMCTSTYKFFGQRWMCTKLVYKTLPDEEVISCNKSEL